MRPGIARQKPRRVGPLLLATLLLLVSGGRAAPLLAQTGPNPLTVSADGTATLTPDLARITASVETRAPTAADALDQNSQMLTAVIAAVEAQGVAEADITTTGLRLDPVSTSAGASGGYRVTNGITVQTTELSRIGQLAQTMTGAGATTINPIEYSLQDPEQLPVQALQAALDNAQREASAIASALGLRLGPALNFSMLSPVPEPSPLTAAVPAAPAAGDTSASLPPVLPGPFTAAAHIIVTYSVLAP